MIRHTVTSEIIKFKLRIYIVFITSNFDRLLAFSISYLCISFSRSYLFLKIYCPRYVYILRIVNIGSVSETNLSSGFFPYTNDKVRIYLSSVTIIGNYIELITLINIY